MAHAPTPLCARRSASRCSSCDPSARTGAGVHAAGGPHARTRHRRQHGNLHRRQCADPAAAALSAAGSAGVHRRHLPPSRRRHRFSAVLSGIRRAAKGSAIVCRHRAVDDRLRPRAGGDRRSRAAAGQLRRPRLFRRARRAAAHWTHIGAGRSRDRRRRAHGGGGERSDLAPALRRRSHHRRARHSPSGAAVHHRRGDAGGVRGRGARVFGGRRCVGADRTCSGAGGHRRSHRARQPSAVGICTVRRRRRAGHRARGAAGDCGASRRRLSADQRVIRPARRTAGGLVLPRCPAAAVAAARRTRGSCSSSGARTSPTSCSSIDGAIA